MTYALNPYVRSGLLAGMVLADDSATTPDESFCTSEQTDPNIIVVGGTEGRFFITPAAAPVRRTSIAGLKPHLTKVGGAKVICESSATGLAEWLQAFRKRHQEMELSRRQARTLALLDRWLAEGGDAKAEQADLERVKVELDKERKGYRPLFSPE